MSEKKGTKFGFRHSRVERHKDEGKRRVQCSFMASMFPYDLDIILLKYIDSIQLCYEGRTVEVQNA